MIIYAAIILLVLLFLKVPVFISVLSASAIYFLGYPPDYGVLQRSDFPDAGRSGAGKYSSVHTDGRPVRIFSGRCSYGM